MGENKCEKLAEEVALKLRLKLKADATQEEVKADVEERIAAAGLGRGKLADFSLKIEPAAMGDGSVRVTITRVGDGKKENKDDGELTDEEITEAVRSSNLVEEVTVSDSGNPPVTETDAPSGSASALILSTVAVVVGLTVA